MTSKKATVEECREFAKYLFERSATLFAILILGLFAKKYKPLVNDPAKGKQVIKFGTRYDIMSTTEEYCNLLTDKLSLMARSLWDEKKGHFTPPTFEIVSLKDNGALGIAVLGLYDE